jgi:hypothetical protein
LNFGHGVRVVVVLRKGGGGGGGGGMQPCCRFLQALLSSCHAKQEPRLGTVPCPAAPRRTPPTPPPSRQQSSSYRHSFDTRHYRHRQHTHTHTHSCSNGCCREDQGDRGGDAADAVRMPAPAAQPVPTNRGPEKTKQPNTTWAC